MDLSFATETEAPTTLAVAELDALGAATYRFHTAETAAPGLTNADVDAAFATAPVAVHIGTLGLVLEPIATALADGIAHLARGTLLMVDPNCRPRVIPDRAAYVVRLHGVLARADVVKVSADDLDFLAPGRTALDGARDLLEVGATLVLLTDGARSVRLVGRSFEVELPVPPIRVVDTVGSGDAFGGGFLARWVERRLGRADLTDRSAVVEVASCAIEVASITCQRPGADPPTRAEVGWSAAWRTS